MLPSHPPQAPAMLSDKWYLEQMQLVRKRFSQAFFIVLSDDPRHCDSVFKDQPDVYVSHQSEAQDFALMSLCAGGILSASSFAWWGAYFAKKTTGAELFIAPKYWFGHGLKKWMPAKIAVDWIEYADVDA